jgi:hypothetical protein
VPVPLNPGRGRATLTVTSTGDRIRLADTNLFIDVLGRHGETSGRCVSKLDVSLAGVPAYRGESIVGAPQTDRSSAVLDGGARWDPCCSWTPYGRGRRPRSTTARFRCRWPARRRGDGHRPGRRDPGP